MDHITIPFYHFYKFQADLELVTEVYNHVKNIQYESNTYNLTSIDKLLNIPIFNIWITKCVEELRSTVYQNLNGLLSFTSIWANKNSRMSSHHKHRHPNSIVSGIYYVNDDYKGGETIFYMNDPWYKIHNEGYIQLSSIPLPNKELTYRIVPKSGLLILFPSYIHHSVGPVIVGSDRYTISFNTFVDGNIGNDDNLYGLNIKILPSTP